MKKGFIIALVAFLAALGGVLIAVAMLKRSKKDEIECDGCDDEDIYYDDCDCDCDECGYGDIGTEDDMTFPADAESADELKAVDGASDDDVMAASEETVSEDDGKAVSDF